MRRGDEQIILKGSRLHRKQSKEIMIITEIARIHLAMKVKANAKIRINEWTETVGEEKIRHNEVEDVVDALFDYVDYFNSLPEYTYYVFDRHINDIQLLDELKPFIIPDSVRLHPTDIRTRDLLVRSSIDKGSKKRAYSYIELINLMSNFRRFFKSDINDKMFSLGSQRVPKSLSDVESIMTCKVNGKLSVNYQDAAFIPLELVAAVGKDLYRDDYFNCSDIKLLLADYFANMRF